MGRDLGARPPRTPYSPPAFPAGLAIGSRSWIQWAVIAVLLIALGAGVLLAQRLGRFSHSANMASPAPSGLAGAATADKDAISPEDKARADALVGPLNREAPAAPPVQNAPATGDATTAAAPAPQFPPPQPEPLPKPAAAVEAAQPPLPAAAPPSRPAAQPKSNPLPQNRPQPTLDDLLD